MITIGLLLAAVACSSESKPNYDIPAQPDGLTILPANGSIEAGYLSVALTLQLWQGGAESAVVPSLATWDTGDHTIATVDKTGTLTGLKQGTVNVTAVYVDPATSKTWNATKTFTVTPAVERVEFSFSDASSGTFQVDSGNPQTVSAVAIYTDHTARDVTADAAFSLQAIPPAIAPTASLAGNVLSTTATTATTQTQLVATYHNRSFSTPVTTLPGTAPTATGDLAGLAFYSASPLEDFSASALTVSVPVETTFNVYSQASYVSGATANDTPIGSLSNVSYDTSDATVVTVSGNTVTAVGVGTAQITAEYVEGGIKKSAAPLTVTVTGATLSHLYLVAASTGANPEVSPFDGVTGTTAPPAGFVLSSDAAPVTAGSFIMPLDATYSVRAIGLYSDGSYREISRTVAWTLANTSKTDEDVHADLSAGSRAVVGTITPPANDPAAYDAGSVTLTATFTGADGTAVTATLPITVTDMAAAFTVANAQGAMTAKASWAGSGLGTNVVSDDVSTRCVFETANAAIAQVDNQPGGANQTVIYTVPLGSGSTTITAWFLPTETSTVNAWTAWVPKSEGSATAP